ncbi:MAG: Ribonuclease [Phycisphaerales bacterium]|nr:Ribonuclease [Phycisphaerales bacterium]
MGSWGAGGIIALMILAGIDEAGYGPLLGPLVVGCSAFEVEGDPAGPPPCVWTALRKLISRNRLRSGKKLHINDSKLVYGGGGSLKELERGVLSIVAASGELPADLESLLAQVAGNVRDEMLRYPWYRHGPQEKFPLEQDAVGLRLFANALRLEMERMRCRCVHLAGKVVCEGELNRMFDATRNKGSTLFSLAAVHLDYLLNTFGDKGLVIICDRQGGRGHYGSLLRLMFDEWSLEIVREEESCSDYRLHRSGHVVSLTFTEKAEAACLPVALASMLCKYLREALMGRFNAYWQALLPGLTPTAGYYNDGLRFLDSIQQMRQEMGVTDKQLIRSR